MKTLDELKTHAEETLALARKLGASAAEVSVSQSLGLDVTVRQQDVETVEFNQHTGFSVTLYLGERKGSASTSDLSPHAISQTLKAALNIANYTQPDEYGGLAPAELMASKPVDLDLDHPWDLDTVDATALGMKCEAAALAVPGILHTEGASVGTLRQSAVYGNSHGFVGGRTGTRHGISCAAIAKEDKGLQIDSWSSMARDSNRLEDPAIIGQKAATRAVSHLSAKPMETGKMPVLFSPEMSRGLISHLLGAISGTSIYKRASYLVDRLGETVASTHFSIHENPLQRAGMGSTWFDADGVATDAKPIINKGVLATYLLGAYSARRLGMTSTGNAGGAHNVLLEGTTLSFDNLLKEMGDGLLVTSLMGQGVNTVTGDYSRGARGFRIRNGEITHPVEEITIASNLAEMFSHIVAIGDDTDMRGNIQTPSMLIESMTVAGNRQ
ncbi:MAG: metalloprotease PmbA [Pseudomonadota bacterium]